MLQAGVHTAVNDVSFDVMALCILQLFTDSVEDDRAAMKEAGVQALQAQQQQGAAAADGTAGSGTKSSAPAAAATAKVR